VLGNDTEEEAQRSVENLKALDAPPPERKSIFSPEMVESIMKEDIK